MNHIPASGKMVCGKPIITRPVLRWHGGKWRLSPWIISQMPSHRVYVEPFAGAASVLLRKPRAYAEVYNDLDCEVVNLFSVMRNEDEAAKLVSAVHMTPFAREEFSLAYQPCECRVERARRLIVRSYMGFGSNGHEKPTGFRACSNRSGTTPAHDWANYPPALAAIIERLRGVVIENRSAVQVMSAHDAPETLHYVDPPYLPDTRDAGSDYAHEMTIEQHVEMLVYLKTVRGRVILSGYPSELYDSALKGWRCVRRAAFADGAKKRTECLWMNFSAADLFGGATCSPA